LGRFRDEMEGLASAARASLRRTEHMDSKNAWGRPRLGSVSTNYPSIVRRLETIQAAIAAAEALELEDTPDLELQARLDTLRAGLPPLELERVPVPSPDYQEQGHA